MQTLATQLLTVVDCCRLLLTAVDWNHEGEVFLAVTSSIGPHAGEVGRWRLLGAVSPCSARWIDQGGFNMFALAATRRSLVAVRFHVVRVNGS